MKKLGLLTLLLFATISGLYLTIIKNIDHQHQNISWNSGVQQQKIHLKQKNSLNLQDQNYLDQFQKWKLKYGHMIENQAEQLYRKIIFWKNYEIMKKHNSDSKQTYKMGINQFSIFNDQQFKERFLTQIFVDQNENKIHVIDIQDGNMKIQQSTENNINNLQNQKQLTADIDWTAKGKVTPVKNQGACGSCWAFSSNAVAQSWALIVNRGIYDLSEQQLMDCSSSYGNKGCNGGLPSWALKYTLNNGAATQAQYPYKASVGTCLKNGGNFKIPTTNSVSGCTGILSAISKRPLSVLVDATNWSRYSSGIFSNCANSINHAVLLVGTVSNNWKIKNSWGSGWGEQGYIRLLNGNTCAICNMPAVYIQ